MAPLNTPGTKATSAAAKPMPVPTPTPTPTPAPTPTRTATRATQAARLVDAGRAADALVVVAGVLADDPYDWDARAVAMRALEALAAEFPKHKPRPTTSSTTTRLPVSKSSSSSTASTSTSTPSTPPTPPTTTPHGKPNLARMPSLNFDEIDDMPMPSGARRGTVPARETLVPHQSRATGGNRHWELKRLGDFEAVDAWVRNMSVPTATRRSVAALAKHLTSRFDSDASNSSSAVVEARKLRAIVRFVAENVDYDPGIFSGKKVSADPQDVLRSGLAVCAGYSELVAALGQAAGLDVRCVVGWTKSHPIQSWNEVLAEVVMHEWNVARVGGALYNIDATWAAGYIDSNSRFRRMWNEHFFLTPPEVFILDHYPERDADQLLAPTISKQAFARFPYVRIPFFVAGLTLSSHLDTVVECTDARDGVVVELGADKTVSAVLVRADDQDNAEIEGSVAIVRLGRVARISVAPPQPGMFRLVVYAAEKKNETSRTNVMEYLVKSTVAVTRRFPSFLAGDAGASVEPLNRDVKRGSGVDFVFEAAPGMAPPVEVAVLFTVQGKDKWESLAAVPGKQGVFKGRVMIPATLAVGSDVKVLFKSNPSSSMFTYALGYKVVS